MAKHKAQQALFDLLRKEHTHEPLPPKVTPIIRKASGAGAAPAPVAAPKPVQPVRTVTPAAGGAPVAAPQRQVQAPLVQASTAPAPSARATAMGGQAPFFAKQLTVAYSHLVIAAVAVICLCVIMFYLGQRYAPSRLPNLPRDPTFPQIQQTPPTPNLVAPAQPVTPGPVRPGPSSVRPGAPERPAVGEKAGTSDKRSGPRPGASEKPAPAAPAGPSAMEKSGEIAKAPAGPEKPAITETPLPPGPQFRVRIAQLSVSQSHAIDQMRDYLSKKDVETELEARGGFYILYSHERFADAKKSDELAGQIRKHLAAFEKETRIPTAKDAYSIRVSKE